MRNMFKRTKELQSLVEATRKSLKDAESKVENRNMLIKEMEEQAKALYEENKDLDFKYEKQKEVLKEIYSLSKTQQYGSVKNLQNKLKELVRPLNQN